MDLTPEQSSAAIQLTERHWEYIEQLLRNEYIGVSHYTPIDDEELEIYIDRVGFHYRSAMLHGFKHGVEFVLSGGGEGSKPNPQKGKG